LTAISLSEGTTFKGDTELDPQHIPSILEFFSLKRTDYLKDSAAHIIIPEMFIDFAKSQE
jgi:hypothetical protein